MAIVLHLLVISSSLQETAPRAIRDVEGMITGTIRRVVAPLSNEGVVGASTNGDSRYQQAIQVPRDAPARGTWEREGKGREGGREGGRREGYRDGERERDGEGWKGGRCVL